ncbi:DUF4129 domain-containing protein [Phytomonospora endophytica]|uniref:Protein-glutamine gamma-glutamyltransferase-like C-terminal domain-containing protein n=1 Tax=Phytomonospora endophytica TaxID=714109 RepID=A0A841G131_9ACTN|nr:DUF4129 domain-containing protein [Phytomonospora endophytica]MBB6039638.1 hypothetical protein [Phytomonospora endophytica]GIG65643.1 hypothetical protein Pen01_19380 [Phytomonospora endophytica]
MSENDGPVSGGIARWWSQLVADISDWYPLGVGGLLLTLLILATVVALFSHGTGWLRRERRYDGVVEYDKAAEVLDDEVPDLPSDQLRARARAYAAAGDHRRAVREWLRASVRDLIDRELIDHRPGWTVTELAAAASAALPPAAVAMDEAARIFSDIWYGQHEADAGHVERMAELDATISAAAGGRLAGSAT